ncbi:MAG: hypothetical protein A2W99_00535 [Bacteroidetes bacterium GWF2_33_16]|nr:MAG: hypothetical protein A2X00_03240 [Bacteroidetes bacterium GWE2_32_14]OFY08758.1 MAG: hypothetical protein A2W99_00535 [Bacteroidetes bacterium GWF2_33_16]
MNKIDFKKLDQDFKKSLKSNDFQQVLADLDEWFKTAKKEDLNYNSALFLKGYILEFGNKDIENANIYYEQVKTIDNLWFTLGNELIGQSPEKAILCYSKVKKDIVQNNLNFNIGLCYEILKDTNKSNEYFNKINKETVFRETMQNPLIFSLVMFLIACIFAVCKAKQGWLIASCVVGAFGIMATWTEFKTYMKISNPKTKFWRS